jgi:raffinose/stachyose/melibiose transport system permease protein
MRHRIHPSRRVPWLFAVPAVAVCFGLFILPALLGAGYAFTSWDGLTSPRWLGLGNFTEFFGDSKSVEVLLHTLTISVAYVVGVNLVGLGLAVALESTLKTRGVLRALFFLPAVVSPLVVAFIWKFMLDANGAINEALGAVGLGSLEKPWLGEPTLALISIVVVMIWQFAGYHMLIYSAGLQSVETELREAAAVDGAGPWRRFRDITLPLLKPAITISVALSTITSLMVFDQVIALTGGGPAGSTETLGTYVYKQAFVNGRYGYSAAVALLLVIGVCIVAFTQFRVISRRGAAEAR